MSSIRIMKEFPLLVGNRRLTISFYPDDTIEAVRQYAALELNSHPNRLYMLVKSVFPEQYYSSNPKHWSELFFRLSYDGKKIDAQTFQEFINQNAINMVPREVTLEQWEDHDEYLNPIYNPTTDFREWRILGVPADRSMVMPVTPVDLPNLKSTQIPIPQIQSLFETFHDYDNVEEIMAVELPVKASELIKRNYFPVLTRDTPNNINNLRNSIQSARNTLDKLIGLDYKKHEKESIVRVKWYIPLISTKIPSPQVRFEQIFYGMTVDPENVPYVGYFTSKRKLLRAKTPEEEALERKSARIEGLRHKFYVEDPTRKQINESFKNLFKGWLANTQPQRNIPTLLFYRGNSHLSFDRIAVTNRDIVIDVRREKSNTKNLDQLREEMRTWISSMDALMPFLEVSDLEKDRWEVSDLSVVASYKNEVKEFDMHRFHCLQNIFSVREEQFRLLRAEHTSGDISQQELQAYELLEDEDAEQSPEYLAEQMSLEIEDARELFQKLRSRGEDFNYDKFIKAYPILKFSGKEVLIKFVTNLERTLQYADILRFVLTTNGREVNSLCPRRMDIVAPQVSIPQQGIEITTELTEDTDFLSFLGAEEEPAPVQTNNIVTPQPTKGKKSVVVSKTIKTHNYFNNRLQEFDKETFDKKVYPNKCDKPKQVVVLTPEDKARMGNEYNYEDADELEKVELDNPQGTAICPPYWCMRDQIPLKPEQLVTEDDGELHCPVCHGKVRTSDKLDVFEYPVIERKTQGKFTPYPKYMKAKSTINGREIPCCYEEKRSTGPKLTPKEEVNYVLEDMAVNLPALRMAYVPKGLIQSLKIETNYNNSIRKGRLLSDEEDVFRVGLGRPSKTIPMLLGSKTPIPKPRDAVENLKRCSFFRTWNKEDPVRTIDEDYEAGTLSPLEELEYVTSFLSTEVILIDVKSNEVLCGFWSDVVSPRSRSIAVFIIPNMQLSVLTRVSRVKETTTTRTEYTADLRKKPFAKQTLPTLRELHTKACSINTPVLKHAITELRQRGMTDYSVILDPLKRVQAVIVPGKIILPVQPTNAETDEGVQVYDGYHQITQNMLPKFSDVKTFTETTNHPGFKVKESLQNTKEEFVELLFTSGFRIPVQPLDAIKKEPSKEVIETIQEHNEDELVNGEPNKQDQKLAQQTIYAEEMYQFLLYSLSKDVQGNEEALRDAILNRSSKLREKINSWYKHNSFKDTKETPIDFINKIRTPCGQLTDQDKCKKSSLCGWHKNTCKIRVKPILSSDDLVERIYTALVENDKVRALVLDDGYSPFFSSVLYLEMPHELITSTI